MFLGNKHLDHVFEFIQAGNKIANNGVILRRLKHESEATGLLVPERQLGIVWRVNPSFLSVIIPDPITSIERSTFWKCTHLTSVTISFSVTKIDTFSIDDTLQIFGNIVNQYTIIELERDGITSKLVYEGRLRKIAADFVAHYEKRIYEGATVAGKAMFVCESRMIAYRFYKELERIRPEWFVKKEGDNRGRRNEGGVGVIF